MQSNGSHPIPAGNGRSHTNGNWLIIECVATQIEYETEERVWHQPKCTYQIGHQPTNTQITFSFNWSQTNWFHNINWSLSLRWLTVKWNRVLNKFLFLCLFSTFTFMINRFIVHQGMLCCAGWTRAACGHDWMPKAENVILNRHLCCGNQNIA